MKILGSEREVHILDCQLEIIVGTRIGSLLLLRIRRAVAKSGIGIVIQIGPRSHFDFKKHLIELVEFTDRHFVHQNNDGCITFTQPKIYTSLFHELTHYLHFLENRKEAKWRGYQPATCAFKGFDDMEEVATITGFHLGKHGTTWYDHINENQFRKELGMLIRQDHLGYTIPLIIKCIANMIFIATNPERMRISLEYLRGALAAKLIKVHQLDPIREALKYNPELTPFVDAELASKGIVTEEKAAHEMAIHVHVCIVKTG